MGTKPKLKAQEKALEHVSHLPPKAPDVKNVRVIDRVDIDEAMSRVQELRAEIFARAADVCLHTMRYAEIDEDAEEPPVEWVQELGPKEAQVAFRLAKYGQRPTSMAPSGQRVAATILVGAMRDDALMRSAPKLNVQLVELSFADQPRQYPTREVTDEE